jgi:hypothetical protein
MQAMQDDGVIRRVALAPNHYALGLAANGMSVWDLDDDAGRNAWAPGRRAVLRLAIAICGPAPCPTGPTTCFAMLHGRTREEVEAKRAEVAALLGDACRGVMTFSIPPAS